MARKKASHGTAPRRSPALRAAPVGHSGGGGRPVVERGDARRAATRVESAAAAPLLQPSAAASLPDSTDREAIETQLLQLVSPHTRVLIIGRDTWTLSRSLASVGCRISVVETRHDAPAGSATFSDRVIVGDPDALDLNALDGLQFDAIVVARLLEHVRDPVTILTALGKHLSPGGCVVAAVPNVMHGRIRLGFLAGQSPRGLLAPDAMAPLHWYDAAALQRMFEHAGFVITRTERQLEGFDADGAATGGVVVPSALVDGLRRDADAMTRTFVVVAHQFPLAGHVRLEMRVGELARTQAGTAEQVRDLAQRTDGLDSRAAEFKRAVDGAAWKLDRIGADLQQVAVRDSQLQPALVAARQRLTREGAELDAVGRALKCLQYEQLVVRVRLAVEAHVPRGAIALVVSKGDERLVTFAGRIGWHFLRTNKGVYAGHHPADSAAAIDALDRLRRDGAGYLVFPQAAFWWLDHYAGLREHLEKHGRVILRDERTAAIYVLDRRGGRR